MTNLRIRELRKGKGLTGEQLGELVGVTKGYISEIETGKKTPGGGLLLRLADALKVTVQDLFVGTAEEKRSASLQAHMEVMENLSDQDRQVIERIALGLLGKAP